MDRCHVESLAWLHEDQSWLQTLLCGSFRRALSWRARPPYEQGFDLRLVPEKLSEPFEWSSPRTVFVNSMSDLFQPGVPDEYIEDVVKVMVEANWHTYQVLTKRSDRLSEMLHGRLSVAASHSHMWWGVSVEDKKYGLPRIGDLKRAPAAIRFLSIELLLEDLGDFDISGIDWAIVGGESGAGARVMRPEWVENVYRILRRTSDGEWVLRLSRFYR